MVDETQTVPDDRAEDERTDEQIEDDPQIFVLSRELSEVHLLLDNISADPDATISALATREPPEGLPDDWIDQVCQISWPPADSNRRKAEQAALLIRVKDYLNRLAKPASGATIAYTVMVTQKEDVEPENLPRRPGVDMDETLSRSSLAEIAFPDLKPRAAAFRKVMLWMNALLVVWLVITCLLSWNVAFGNSTLGEYALARTRLTAAQQVVDDLEAGRRRTAAATGNGGTADTGTAGTVQTAVRGTNEVSAPEVAYCERWRLIRPVRGVGGAILKRYESADQRQACRELEEAAKQVDETEKRLGRWLWLWSWLPGIHADEADPASTATRLASVLGTAVLPVFYGVLGAAAAVLRSLSHKIKTSTLSPRDLNLSLQQLALGAVIGACIGLFIVGGETALIGPVALSGSAISFIAGFGVEAVFQALEALISRIFNIAPAAGPRTRGDAA